MHNEGESCPVFIVLHVKYNCVISKSIKSISTGSCTKSSANTAVRTGQVWMPIYNEDINGKINWPFCYWKILT